MINCNIYHITNCLISILLKLNYIFELFENIYNSINENCLKTRIVVGFFANMTQNLKSNTKLAHDFFLKFSFALCTPKV